MSRLALTLTTLVMLSLGGCAAIKSNNGYVVDEAKPADVQIGVDTKATVLERLGSPSTTASFDPNTWFYISSEREEFLFNRPKTVARNVTEIKFNKDETVKSSKSYKLEDGRVVNYADAETPTLGRQMTVFEQIFGNIGKGSNLPPSDRDLPGGRRD